MTTFQPYHLSISENLATCLMKPQNPRTNHQWQACYTISVSLQCTPQLTGSLILELRFKDEAGDHTVVVDQCKETQKNNHLLTRQCELDVKGNITATGTITPDYVFESGYALKTIEEHAAFMWEEKHLPAVRQAKTNDYGKGVVNLGERSQNLLEELEVAHIYIEQLSNKIKKIESRLASLEQSKK